MLLDGTFSIEEIEVKSTSRRKAAKTDGKKAGTKSARTAKRAPRPKTKKKVAGSVKPVSKSKAQKKVAGRVKPVAKPKTGVKPATVELGLVVLASSPGIRNIAELKETLATARGAASLVVVDAAEVESIDTAALQLLVAFANSVREKSRIVEWKEPSAVFCEMADLVDLSKCLGISGARIAEEDDGLCPVF